MLMKIENLVKYYGNKRAVDGISLEINEGQLVAFIGTNGAGKSTTIRMLVGLLKPDEGEIKRLLGTKIGIVFQDSILDSQLSVFDNLKIRSKLYHNIDKDWIERLYQMLDISPTILRQKYGHLSGGQRRKIDIARALLHRPNILFLDEPTTGLDIESRQKIWSVMRDLQEKEKMAIFLTTHYLEEANNADWTYIVDGGRVLAEGSARTLKEQYLKTTLDIELLDLDTLEDVFSYPIHEGKVSIPVSSPKEAIAILKKYQDYIKHFSYTKGDMNSIFLKVVGKEINS
ncbi:MAG: ABC transporter ATP-binding protein [Streptococcus sp.]|nr:ABC transporter ATP-binding protein [Streptococcus sp.]